MQEGNNIEEYVEENEVESGGEIGWKDRLRDFIEGKYFVPIVIVLISIIAFSLGRISGLQEKREPVRVIDNSPPNPSLILREGGSEQISTGEVKGSSTSSSGTSPSNSSGQVVASKNGTKYHYPWCAGAKQISEKNKISFNSIEEARAAGYSPASNCKGLK